jgi:uncharacterized protein YdeI (YjbR/CyaY-like superfamily)
MNPEVNWFFEKNSKWQDEYAELREIILECGLSETLKWGCPCYTNGKSNILLIHGFKDYCALLFMQGALIADPSKILILQTENVQAARQIRFTNLEEITSIKAIIKSYIMAAVAIDNTGQKVVLKKMNDYIVPEEFQKVLDHNRDIKIAFESLTPGRQKGYIFYFSQAKQAKTREARIEKYIPKILDGKGLED